MDIKVEYDADISPTEFVFETVELPRPSKNIAIWSNIETKKLIDLYKILIYEVGPLKRFKRKKDMWNEISLQVSTKNPKQCEERFKTLLRRKNKGIEKVYISEATRKTYDIIAKDDEDDSNEFQINRNNKPEEIPIPFKEVNVWSNGETKLLMDLYKRFICEVGPRKTFMHKKDMWVEIATNFVNKDSKQCEQRYNTVLKRKTKNFTKVYISKARRRTIDFKAKDNSDTGLKIKRVFALQNDETINDIEKANQNSAKRKGTNTHDKTTIHTDNKEVLSIAETLLKISAKKEEGKERRHRERMEAFEKMQNIFQQILNDKNK